MKRSNIIVTALAMVCAGAAMSCAQTPDKALQEAIEESRQMLPLDAGDGMTISAIEADGDYIVYTVLCDESMFTITDLKLVPEASEVIKTAMKAQLKHAGDKDAQKLVELLKSGGKGLKYNISGEKTGEVMVITIEPDEI